MLREVSRSFYLSLRFLPSGFREPASLGYLLARLSDTVADTETVPVEERRALLANFRELLQGGGEGGEFARRLREEFVPRQVHEGERVLMEKSAMCLSWFRALKERPRALVEVLLGHITAGQTWDLERFDAEGVTRLQDDAELEHYAYRVAGCVGEFWTDLGFLCDPEFSAVPRDELRERGRRFGMGLQLVNILRDVPEDLRKGRCYLPGEGATEGPTLVEDMQPWLEKAEDGMKDGLAYAGAVKGRRIRFASGLPALIGQRTLERLRAAEWSDLEARVKVSRQEVRASAWKAFVASLAPGVNRWR